MNQIDQLETVFEDCVGFISAGIARVATILVKLVDLHHIADGRYALATGNTRSLQLVSRRAPKAVG